MERRQETLAWPSHCGRGRCSEHGAAPGDAGSRLGSRLRVLEPQCVQSHGPSQGPGRPPGTGFSQATAAGSPQRCGGPEGHAAAAVALTCPCHPRPASQWLFLEARAALRWAPPAQPRQWTPPMPAGDSRAGCAARTGAEPAHTHVPPTRRVRLDFCHVPRGCRCPQARASLSWGSCRPTSWDPRPVFAQGHGEGPTSGRRLSGGRGTRARGQRHLR